MVEFDNLYGSRFLTAGDLKAPVTARIEKIEVETFTRDGQRSRPKAVVYFEGTSRPVVLNQTNATSLARAFGKDFTAWIGRDVEVRPETTTYGGKIVPALRLYPAPPTKIGAKPPPTQDEQKPRLEDAMSDKIPW
jgi:hypothetical protein